MQRRKFQTDANAGRMLKQPLAHRLRKALRNDSTSAKPAPLQVPQAQKNASPSLLGGLRTPFASLFSSFRKPKRQPPKPPPQEQQCPTRYDHFALAAHPSSKVEEMAKTETGDSPSPFEPTNKGCDSTKVEVEENMSTWNEQLENELLRVLGNLDDQLAREQAQDSVNRKTPTDYGSRAPDTNQHSTITRPTFLGRVQRNDRSMFLSDGTRTLRAREEHKTPVRPRMFYDTYFKRHHAEDYAYWDVGSGSTTLKRGHSTRSLGQCSEGSLGYSSATPSNGFGHKDFMYTDNVSRSYSLSCLARRQSLGSADQLSIVGLQHPSAMEGNGRFTQRNCRLYPRRTPLSSVVWNAPQSSEHPQYPESLLRTRSLMEFGPAVEDTYPCALQENTRYEFYRSKVNYRRTLSNTNYSSGVSFADKRPDPLRFDNQDNYALHQWERNIPRPHYRYPPLHGRMNLSRKSFPCERLGQPLFRPDGHQYYNDEVFFASDANFESNPANLNDYQSPYAKNISLWQRESDAQNHVLGYTRSMNRSEDATARLFSRHAKGMHNCPMYNSTAALPFVKASVSNEPGLSVSKDRTEYAVQKQNLLVGAGQISSKPLVMHTQTKQNFKTFASDDIKGTDQSGSVGSGDAKEGTFEPVSQQIDSNSPTEPSIAPSKNSSVTVPQNNVLLKPPLPSGSERQAKSTSKREIEKMHSSSIRNRNGQQNEGDCATNYCDQMSLPPSVTGNCTRAPIPQSLQQEEHQSESLRALGHNKKCKNISAPDSSRGPEIFTDEQLPEPCTEKFSRRNSFVRHATTTKITGSPSNSPPKSPMIYYNLPRKSASIDGSVLLEKPMSSAKRPIKNLIAMGNNFDRHISNRLENLYSNRDKLSCVSPASSSLNPSPKENTPQIRDCHLLSTQDPRHRSTTDVISSKSGKGTMIGSPEKSEAPVFSDCEETDEGNPLQQYKTTSKLTVSIEEDNVQYHELISVYYTLPRKQSRTLWSLFLDDTKNTDSSLPLENYRAPQKKYEVRIGLASVAFPSSLEREEKAGSPGKMPVTHGMPQNSEIPDDPDKGGPDVISPTTERASASQAQSTMYHRGGLGVQTEAPVLVRSNRIALNDPLSELKPRVTVNESVNIITNALGKLHIGTCPSPLKESSERDNTLSFSSSNPTDTKIPLENVAAASFAMDAQKESLLCCQPSAKATKSNKLHILPSRSIGSNQEGKYAANPATDILENSAGEKTRQNAEVKERARYICHIISKKGNGLQPRNKSIRSGLDEAVISETKVCSDFQKQTFQLDAASKVNLALQTNIPERIALKHSKTEQEETPQNSLTYEDCTHLQSFEKNSVDNQNVNSKDQFSSTTQDLLNRSATENKLILDCMKDKASDIEKRKNRPSIKNKLAAMYKTSRKFSSKKSLSPKPHINSIFSQNGAPSLEISESHGMLISPDVPQSLLQTGNENQNLNPLPDELDNIVLDQLENKKSQINEGPLLVTNESRRPFANLCNQKRETGSVRQSDKKTINSPQNLTALFPEEIVSTLNISQARIKALENNNRSVFSRITAADLGQKKKDISNVSESSFSQHSPDKISNLLMKNDSKSNIYQPQKVVSPTGYNHDQNIKQSNRLNRNLPCVEPVVNLGKMQRERHFSETSYAREPLDHQASGSNFIRHNSRYGRKFKSYSELLSCDENENWEPYNDSNRTFGSRRVMYPSIEFGIFGKEQQQAFLDNIKRSLTEGRLWRPCLLKNPGCLRKEESGSLNMSEQLTSSFAERNASAEGSSLSEPTDVHGKGPVDYSDSDSDTTTDDEYYLDDGDKESEL
ncbi:exophilin-5 isoform X2 [Hemicordylus capensis]|nr:exophilin-5 isoform X2 [Hemicordylus capensis]XP_053166940.1 exophilin-5 isoform X2 [Hemicordylus capensis]